MEGAASLAEGLVEAAYVRTGVAALRQRGHDVRSLLAQVRTAPTRRGAPPSSPRPRR